jgi:tetratricopeptide (TPR) repeat protein
MKRVFRWVYSFLGFWRSLKVPLNVRRSRQNQQFVRVRSRALQPLQPYPSAGRQLLPTALANPPISASPPASDDYIICATPRAEIVEALNRTLNHVPANDRAVNWETSCIYRGRLYREEPLDRISALSDLAYLCERQERHIEAERLYQQVIALQRQQFGDEHLALAESLIELSSLYRRQNRYAQAQPLLQQALIIRQQLLIGDHPHIAETSYHLADSFCHQQLYAQAESLYQQALTIFRKHLGAQHPRTQAVYSDLMYMIATAIESGQFDDLIPEPPPLDLNSLSATYFWAKPSWERT